MFPSRYVWKPVGEHLARPIPYCRWQGGFAEQNARFLLVANSQITTSMLVVINLSSTDSSKVSPIAIR